MAKKRGTSAFTHVDDATAPIHTSHPGHFDALHYGDTVEDEPETIILGPPAFGSPDPRTLGHRMHPADTGEGRPASAPALDPEFHALQKTNMLQVRVVSEDELNEMSKKELYELAKAADLNPNKSDSKADLVDLILESEGQSESADESSENEDEEGEEDESEEEENNPSGRPFFGNTGGEPQSNLE